MTTTEQFLDILSTSIEQNTFAKLSLGDYRGKEEQLKKLIAKRVIIKKKEHLSFVYRHQTKDITKNHLTNEGIKELHQLIAEDQFRYAHLCTTANDFKLQRNKKGGGFTVKTEPPTVKQVPSLQHNKQKDRKIAAAGDNYLHALGITDGQGNVRKNGQDKYRQINHYIEILSSLLKEFSEKEALNLIDMGSGKGYLTFALFDYLQNKLKRKAHITGVEFRADLVKLCNEIATQSKFETLEFTQGTIEDYTPNDKLDVLIALHACDTATDDAIHKGITNNAELIVAAPCCHKQIRKEISKSKKSNDLDHITKHGIFLERQAEMVTDSLRALYLEHAGYATKVFEFIATEHTPKNVLIVGQKRKKDLKNQANILEKINATKEYFGIETHQLGELLNL